MSQAVNDGPPAGMWDEAPPSDNAGGGNARGRNGGRSEYQRKEPSFDQMAELRDFYGMLDDTKFQKELHAMLPDTITVQSFIRTAKTAVQNNPNLLNPEWRPSLLRCITKAASQGLLPDGKHGALIPRKDNQAGGKYQVCWQPMIWGITQLGRRAGALKKISAHIVFEGEEYELLGGEDDVIRHKIDPKIVDEVYRPGVTPQQFFDKVVLAYCIITAPDGTVTWRWMPKSRIMAVRDTSKAGTGPWTGVFRDEMVIKTVMLFTSKWIDLDGDTPEMRRFKEALETDMEADFDLVDGRTSTPSIQDQTSRPALTHSPKLDNLAEKLAGKDKVEVKNAQPMEQQTPPDEAKKEQQRQQTSEMVAGAKKFAGEILSALGAAQDSDDVDAIVTAKMSPLKRIRANYDNLYKGLIADLVGGVPGFLDKVGGLQNVFKEFHQDIIDKAMNPANTQDDGKEAA